MERNTKKVSIPNKSPFVTGPVADAIGPYGDNDIVDKILDGTDTHTTLGLHTYILSMMNLIPY